MPRSFALGERFEKLIDAHVKAGYYNNASEVVRDALRLLEDKVMERERNVKELKALLAEADDEEIPGDEVYAYLIGKYGKRTRRKA